MFKFKKIASVLASTLMIGSTVGLAAAANYPSPYSQGGTAVVYGTSSLVASSDLVAAADIMAKLNAVAVGSGDSGSSASVSGEAVSLDSNSDRIWLNTSLNSVKSTLTKSDLPTILMESSFSGDVDATLTPTIKLIAGAAAGGDNSGKVIFAKQPKSSSDPVLGISLGSSATSNPLYNASVTFSKAVNFTDSDTQGETIELFGNEFVVSTETDSTDLVLFKSAQTVTLTVGGNNPSPTSTVVVDGTSYDVTLTNGDSDTAYLIVNGDSGSINEGASKKIGGLEIAVKDVVAGSDSIGTTATLLMGSAKLTLTNGATVTVGSDDDPLDGTTAYIVGGTAATTEIAVAVYRPDSSTDAILEGDTFEDPVFGSFKVDFAGMSSPLASASREMISVDNSGDDTMTLTMTDSDGNAGTIDFAHNATYGTLLTGVPVKKPANWRLADDSNNSIYAHEGANLTEDDYVVLGNEDYGHLLQVTQIYNNTGTTPGNDRVKFQDVLSDTTYDTTFSSTEGSGTLTIDGKQYTVVFQGSGDSGYATVKYPTSDSSTTSTWVFYPTIKTDDGALVSLYEPLNITMGAVNGTTATAATVIQLPDGDGYTSVTFTYAGMGNWTLSGGASGLLSANQSTGANYTTATIGQLTYNFTSGGNTANYANNTMIYLVDPEGSANIDNPAVVIFEDKDDSSNYEAIVVDLETAPAGNSDNGVGVNDVLFSSPTHYSASLQSDSDMTQDVDWYGTLVTTDASESDQKTVEISYPSSQFYAQIFVGEMDSSVTPGTSGGTGSVMLIADSEVSSASGKNLIVVGGSCVNTVAAELLQKTSPLCGSDFTTQTGVGAGQFLVETFSRAGGKVATLVAGYNAGDTTNAAKYLTTQTVDTSVGKKYIGTTATNAELQVA